MKGCHTFISEDFFPKIYIRENCMIYIWNHFYFFKIYAGWENYLIKIYRNVPPGKYEWFNRHLSIATENVLSLTYSSRCVMMITCTLEPSPPVVHQPWNFIPTHACNSMIGNSYMYKICIQGQIFFHLFSLASKFKLRFP